MSKRQTLPEHAVNAHTQGLVHLLFVISDLHDFRICVRVTRRTYRSGPLMCCGMQALHALIANALTSRQPDLILRNNSSF